MGLLADGLNFDLGPTFVPKTIGDFLKEVSTIGNVSEKNSRLDDFVKGLEEEMEKIDAFKRELPLCMILLNDAILALKDEAERCAGRNPTPLLEEFIPLKKRNRDEEEEGQEGDNSKSNKKEIEIREKKNWMRSVQLWNAEDHRSSADNGRIADPKLDFKVETERNEKKNGKNRSDSRAFLSFGHSGFPLTSNSKEGEKQISSAQGLSLLSPTPRNPKDGSVTISTYAPNPQPHLQSVPPPPRHQQTARKQRRCWSTDLHRRFVDALQHLGGSEVATPKQIRELMKVEGLTNDEVKSHLQKYRLHTRKIQPDNLGPTPVKQLAVVLGANLRNSHDFGESSSKGNSSHTGSPQGPFQLAATTGGDSMDDEEDEKSEER